MPLSEDDVRYAFRFLLGREIEGEAMIQQFIDVYADLKSLREGLMSSEEYRLIDAARNAGISRFPADAGSRRIETRAATEPRAHLIVQQVTHRRALGEAEPWWSCLPDDRFRAAQIDAAALDAFWQGGKEEAEQCETTLRRHNMVPGAFRTCVEFGCGVGRLTRALAGRFPRVIATDISSSHLETARRALDEAGLSAVNTVLLSSNAAFEALPRFEALVSVQALQYLAPPVARHFLERLLARLKPEGIAYLQLCTGQLGYAYDPQTATAPAAGSLETHAFPQDALFEVLHAAGCVPLEFREDHHSSPQRLSNTLLLRKLPAERGR
jgi:cyclopropane fatty-acyl-phospholipid synthase-like methyltransferase